MKRKTKGPGHDYSSMYARHPGLRQSRHEPGMDPKWRAELLSAWDNSGKHPKPTRELPCKGRHIWTETKTAILGIPLRGPQT